MGKQWKQWLTLFSGAPESLQMAIAALKLKDTYFLELLHLISTVNEQVFQLWSEKGLIIRGSDCSRGEVVKLGSHLNQQQCWPIVERF